MKVVLKEMKWYVVASLLTLVTSSQGILTTLSQRTDGGGYNYDYATIPFLAEIFKLIVSGIFLWREFNNSSKSSPHHPPRITTEWKTVRLYPIPSIIYLFHNNLQFATLTYVDASTYQIMGNLKIVTTALLFRLYLKRKLSTLQWMAIVLLAVGTTTSQMPAFIISYQHLYFLVTTCLFYVKGCGEASCDSLFSSPIQGYMLGSLSACLSALAGVYTEFLMKKNNDTLYWHNVQLYTFGAIFNIGRLFLDDFRGGFENGPWWNRFFNGYTITTWLVMLNLGSTGLLVSWLMKYADNIVKVYSTSMAMLLTMVLSVFLFTFKPTLQVHGQFLLAIVRGPLPVFILVKITLYPCGWAGRDVLVLGIIICIMSLHMYFALPSSLVDLPMAVKAEPQSIEISVDRRTNS